MDLETLLGELREPQPDPATESDGVHPACFSIEAGHHATSTAIIPIRYPSAAVVVISAQFSTLLFPIQKITRHSSYPYEILFSGNTLVLFMQDGRQPCSFPSSWTRWNLAGRCRVLTFPEKEKQPAGCGNVAPIFIAYYYPYSILFLDKLFLLVERIWEHPKRGNRSDGEIL